MKIVHDWLFIILLFSSIPASASSGGAVFGGFESKPEKGRISFSNPGYELSQILKDGSQFIKPEMEGAGSRAEPGQPDLPTISTYYAVEPGKIFTREQLIKHMTGRELRANDRTVDVTIRRIRKHFEGEASGEIISTIHGEGYRFTGNID